LLCRPTKDKLEDLCREFRQSNLKSFPGLNVRLEFTTPTFKKEKYAMLHLSAFFATPLRIHF